MTLLLARTIPGQQSVAEYKQVNRRESVEVADAFLSYNFLDNQVSFLRASCTVLYCTVLFCTVLYCTVQVRFLRSKGKLREARIFTLIKSLRPLWSKLL